MIIIQVDEDVLLDEGDGGVVEGQGISKERREKEREREEKDKSKELNTLYHLSLVERFFLQFRERPGTIFPLG